MIDGDMDLPRACVNVLRQMWGERYGVHYANALCKSAQRHLNRIFEFYCCMEDQKNHEQGVRVISLLENMGINHGRKTLFGRRHAVVNSSVFRFDVNRSNAVSEAFLREISHAEDRVCFDTEQVFLIHVMCKANLRLKKCMLSYNWSCHPAAIYGCSTGVPIWMRPYMTYNGKNPHYYLRPAPWVADYWGR